MGPTATTDTGSPAAEMGAPTTEMRAATTPATEVSAASAATSRMSTSSTTTDGMSTPSSNTTTGLARGHRLDRAGEGYDRSQEDRTNSNSAIRHVNLLSA